MKEIIESMVKMNTAIIDLSTLLISLIIILFAFAASEIIITRTKF